jgi:tetratricopeptide (TPR) repeat protein
MRSSRVPQLSLAALLVLCFGAAASLDVWFQGWQGSRTQSADVLSVLLGDARRLFANSAFVEADAYFHSGFYPTIFDDKQAFETPHIAEDSGTVAGHNHGDETAFMGKPLDWIDSFGRDFIPSRHTHLDQGGASGDLGESSEVGEILPWLKLSAELDPNDVRNYTVAAYWLRKHLGKTDEAEQFLLEGWRQNPNSVEIIFELGQLQYENHHDITRARNLWELALKYWQAQEDAGQKPDDSLYQRLVINLAHLEEEQGNLQQALHYREMEVKVSPFPDVVRKEIAELKQQLASPQPKKPDSGPPAIH